MQIHLREVRDTDLPAFWQQLSDPSFATARGEEIDLVHFALA
jgi:hypothetical protein